MLTILPDFSMYTFYTRMVGAKAEALNKDENMKVTPEQIMRRQLSAMQSSWCFPIRAIRQQ